MSGSKIGASPVASSSPRRIPPSPPASAILGRLNLNLASISSAVAYSLSLNLSDEIGAYIARRLAEAKTTIEQELGYALDWDIRNKGGEISISDEGIQIWDKNDWPVQHDWFGDRLEDFQRVLQPRVVTLEQEALNVPELRQAHEQRGLQAQILAGLFGGFGRFSNRAAGE